MYYLCVVVYLGGQGQNLFLGRTIADHEPLPITKCWEILLEDASSRGASAVISGSAAVDCWDRYDGFVRGEENIDGVETTPHPIVGQG
jgi:hypothetical protein